MFPEMSIKKEYRSLTDDIVNDFYNPLLNEALLYKRAVGFFSSSALIEITRGINGLVDNNGKIQLVASPHLSPEDIAAIESGIRHRNDVISSCLISAIEDPQNQFEEQRLALLAKLVAKGTLEIKIALIEKESKIGIYHEKMGLLYDNDRNIVAFSGSMNESKTAFSHNCESIDVFCSWTADSDRVFSKESTFNAIWNDYEPYIRVVDFPEAVKEKLLTYRKNADELLDVFNRIDSDGVLNKKTTPKLNGPCVPETIKLRQYQIDAIISWEENEFVGIFDMATGTGKTYTGLAAVAQLYEKTDRRLAVLIVCPYQHLVEQWVSDIEIFGMRPIIAYSASPQKGWKKRLQDAVMGYSLGVSNHFCMVTTNATFSTDYVQSLVNKLKGNVVLVVDEAHNFGATNLSKTLQERIPYRLALSATIDRHGDPEGTEKLYKYFKKKCIEFSLKDAIQSDMLTPYYYYPLVVFLSDEERANYKELTKKIINCCSSKDGKLVISDAAKMLLIKRARLVAAAASKIPKLEESINQYKNSTHILVYCGATTLKDPGYIDGNPDSDEKRQIDIVADLLGNRMGMRISKFTSEESASERELIKAEFSDGGHIQALIAIRCLDEGVNIPNIKTAFIMASSTNPKEYIQRRGRVLRKAPGKKSAVIYDFITLPIPFREIGAYSDEEINSLKSLASREIVRIKDFAEISENPSDADELIQKIYEAYNIIDDGGDLNDI